MVVLQNIQEIYTTEVDLLSLMLKYENNNIELDKPKFLEMVEIADKLSSATKYEFIRVDLYSVNNQLYFGELTFVFEKVMHLFNQVSLIKLQENIGSRR